MFDKNGVEIRTGHIVKVTGAFFKNDNGLYYVEHSPGDPSWSGQDHCLKKVCKDGASASPPGTSVSGLLVHSPMTEPRTLGQCLEPGARRD